MRNTQSLFKQIATAYLGSQELDQMVAEIQLERQMDQQQLNHLRIISQRRAREVYFEGQRRNGVAL